MYFQIIKKGSLKIIIWVLLLTSTIGSNDNLHSSSPNIFKHTNYLKIIQSKIIKINIYNIKFYNY